MGAAALAIAVLVLLLAARAAAASTASATFDDQTAGTFIDTQYSSAAGSPVGVQFHTITNGAFGEPDGFRPHVDSASLQAHSGISPRAFHIAWLRGTETVKRARSRRSRLSSSTA